jgi:two-component system, LytTR family, response regulator AlgR
MKILLVDDEVLARQRLEKMLQGIEGYTIVGEAENGAQALQRIQELKPDIVFMDIRMPGVDGLEAAQAIANDVGRYGCRVIFTTAYDEYALAAFDLQATGYLLKPINKEKLEKALEQAARMAVQKPAGHREHLSSSSRGKIELIPLENVRVLQADHKYVTAFHSKGESILDESLKMLEDEFGDRFRRVHRNALVAVEYVLGLDRNKQGQYVLKMEGTDARPVVSRRLLTEVRQWIKKL